MAKKVWLSSSFVFCVTISHGRGICILCCIDFMKEGLPIVGILDIYQVRRIASHVALFIFPNFTHLSRSSVSIIKQVKERVAYVYNER